MKCCTSLLIGLFFLASCSTSKRAYEQVAPASIQVSRLQLLDEYQIPYKMPYNGTIVGGLSGIDYDASKNVYYIISDDRSNINPGRFYKAEIRIQNNRVDSLVFLAVDTLRRPGGSSYPSHRQLPFASADPESIRYHPQKNTLVWTSEGERELNKKVGELQQAFIYEMDSSGYFIDSFLLPGNLLMKDTSKGPSRNSAFEGCSFTPDGKFLFVSCEEPLLQDGPPASVHFAGALTRITKFDVASKKPVAQFVYPLDAIAHAPKPSTAFAVNGVSEILCLSDKQLLVMERSFSTGRLNCTIKIFLVNLQQASNVMSYPALTGKRNFTKVQKRLLLNTDLLNRYFDNMEGMCFGPVLSNGHQSLLMMADDNFNPLQKTQLLLFEVIP